MKKNILLLSFSFFTGFFFIMRGQQYPEKEESQNILEENQSAYKPVIYQRALFIGGDLFQPLREIIDKKNRTYEFFANVRLYKKFHLAFQVGHSQLSFDRIDWKAQAFGVYYKLGANWFLYENDLDPEQAYYAGLYFAYTPYQQEIQKRSMRYPGAINIPLPRASLEAYWFEPLLGARVRLAKTPFFIDIATGVKILLYTGRQERIDPLILPGFGEALNSINWAFRWGLSYRIPIGSKL